MSVNFRREGRRRQIQRIAAELFLERGYDAVSVRELAAAAGVRLPTLYWYIGSKQQLLRDIYATMQAENLRRFEQVAAEESPPAEKLRRLVHELLSIDVEMRAEAGVFHKEEHRIDPDFIGAQAETRRRIDGIVRDVLREGAEADRWDRQRLLVARMTLWAFSNFLHRWYRPDGSVGIDELADQFTELLLRGLRGDALGPGEGARGRLAPRDPGLDASA